ncbi:CheB methylesterase domain-containing protein [Campylobacter troglodytis]|uniref:CheB methylesterase domain-containing protein n=1 Tax=Campylobacter troglodytis TaxID=654363 RepID=UPI00115995A0|nr:CheB methylesterase domain-containing protein [Campylobacter troglodytis]TQR57327.1 chemotaxis protein CheB [Campylobacter troglodytis]
MNIVLIGSSTGGPNQVKFLLKDIDMKHCCAVVAQHMGASFLPNYVRQFNQEALAEVVLANDKEPLVRNKIFVCKQNTVFDGNLNPTLNFSPQKTTFNPNVDLLFNSAINIAKTNKILAIILTGMGDDGAKGLFELYKVGVQCLGESEADCVVYGMPKKAKELNPKLKQMGLAGIKTEIIKFVTGQESGE